ncbi:UDP-N-acetylmuramate dehydrogenase [Candidatus Chlorohelix sp.]|uniref:UDP-N-acetylmuramate dehydrogenase n=1 Tax=Candidatus Chlorohelix sp. TaxID=3139201 RepID=UPI0030387035
MSFDFQGAKLALERVLGKKLVLGELLAKHTSYRIGGAADFFARITREDDMLAVLRTCWELSVPLLVLGNGSNVLISDLGWRGMVVENRMAEITINPQPDETAVLKAGSGALLGNVARRVAKEGWAGFEFAATIPGSVGGGIVSNAGAHGSDLSKALRRVEVATRQGERKLFAHEELGMSYRHTRWREHVGMDKAAIGEPGNELILWAEFELRKGDSSSLKEIIDEMTNWRREKQPQEPSAGSVFKNPPAPFPSSGKMIEEVGLKGKIIGKAQISPRHANFIVNLGGAQASDVMALIRLAQKLVKEKFGAELELELEILGDWDTPLN